jgi:glycosyltransferase involved in cell wall biosynthesis
LAVILILLVTSTILPPKVYFLLPYVEKTAPSQRFRVEAYYSLMTKRSISYKVGYFWSAGSSHSLYKKGNTGWKVFYLCKGFVNRWWQILVDMRGAEYVFIHREAAPLGPPVFEWVISKLLKKKVIYDFDDAIWIPNVSENNRLATYLKAFWKVKYICKWSYKVSVGNHYLGDWAARYNSNIVYNPTCVDMETRYNVLKAQQSEKVVIGWTGSHSTLKYLELVRPVLEDLEKEYPFEFLVICDTELSWNMKSLRFIRWSEKSEIDDLLQINIGIMPLEEDVWCEGKCGFKLIQYLALGIPAVASPIGVNKHIIRHGQNGYLCDSMAQWKDALVTLLQDAALRKEMGKAGREKMASEYSTASNETNFISLFT